MINVNDRMTTTREITICRDERARITLPTGETMTLCILRAKPSAVRMAIDVPRHIQISRREPGREARR